MEMSSIVTKRNRDEYGVYYTEEWHWFPTSKDRQKHFEVIKNEADVVKVEFINFRNNCTVSQNRLMFNKIMEVR